MMTTIATLHEQIKSGKASFSSYVRSCLEIIEANANLNAFVAVFRESAIAQAKALDDRYASGKLVLGKLTGVTISIKDNICYKGHPCSAGSKILEGYVSPYSSTAVDRLVAEGAIIIGSSNCDQFGMGSTSTNSHYGSVKNALDNNLIAGGSSGGAAVSVQIGACMFALGSDTGGSVRQPAAFTNTIGFKPTYGAVSRYGLIAYGSSFDQIGIVGNNYDDISTVFQVMKGQDPNDATTIEVDEPPLKATDGIKLAYIPQMFEGNGLWMQPARETLEKLSNHSKLIPFSFDFMEYLVPIYYILSTAEASSNLSRFDGVRYGFRADEVKDLQDMYVRSRTLGFGREVRKRIMMGTFVLSEGYFDAYFTKALRIRRMLRDQINTILKDNDALIMPVSTSGPWRIDQKIEDPNEIYLSDIYTVLANLVGMPSLTVPVSSKVEESPIIPSLQILSKSKSDLTLFNLADRISKYS
jgi:aspartyl-tRNA(Asn)/glutamyl-tRNA(Gln) amidotransferase subunit A